MEKGMDALLSKTLKKIKPTKKERKKLLDLARKVILASNLEADKFKANAILAGSVTRDTWLPGKNEFDVFIIFPTDMPPKTMEATALNIGKKIFQQFKGKWKIEYAQHPYVSGEIKGSKIDIVPCYNVKSPTQLMSAVDRTPFHVRYIEKNLRLEAADQVRILKQFLTANGIYGADAATEGFSGYVCELLLIKYKKFIELLKNVSKWSPGEIIDLENYYSKEEHHKLKEFFKNHALILIDPVDKNRNTGAAISVANFFKFKKLAQDFLKRPSKDFFFEKRVKPLTSAEFNSLHKKRMTQIIFVSFKPPQTVSDILWPQLRKFRDRLVSILEEKKYEFKVLRSDVYTNEKDLAVVLLEMEVFSLPLIQKRVGPSVFDFKDAERFLGKYKNQALSGPFVEDSYWAVETKRKFLTAVSKLNDSLDKNEKTLLAKGIPNLIAQQIVKDFHVFTDVQIIKIMKKDKNFGIFLRKYFEKENHA